MKWLKDFKLFETVENNFIIKNVITIEVDNLNQYDFLIEKTNDYKIVTYEYEPDNFILSLGYDDGIINNKKFIDWALELNENDLEKNLNIEKYEIRLVYFENIFSL
jgi:hypothetical protein